MSGPDKRGWIKLHRKIVDWRFSPKAEHRPHTRREAWEDMLLMANHEARMVGEYLVERGQILTSIQRLANEFRWSHSKVRRFLAALSKATLSSDGKEFGAEIDIATDHQATMITINNYETYQANRQTDDEETDEGTANERRTSGERSRDKQELENGNALNPPKKEGDSAKIEQIIDQFHRHSPSLPSLRKIDQKRKGTLKARMRENPDFDWTAFFQRIEASDFLAGRKKDWRADFDWILKPDNFKKILEGNYDNRNNGHKPDFSGTDYGSTEGGRVTV